MPATTAPVIITDTGMPTTSTSTMMACPSMVSSCPEVGPGFHLDERPEREVGQADRCAGRAVVAEQVDLALVPLRVVAAEVAQEHRRIHAIRDRRAGALPQRPEVPHGLNQPPQERRP